MPRQSRSSRLATAVRFAGLVVLVGLVVRVVDVGAVARSWEGLPPAAIASILAAWHLAAGLRLLRWSRQARAAGIGFDPTELARTFAWGLLVGAVTPLRLGELWRLSALEPGRRGDAAALVVWEKGVEANLLLSLAALGAGVVFGAPLVGAGMGVGVAIGWTLLLGPARVGGRWARLTGARDAVSGRERAIFVALTLAAQLLNMAAGAGIYLAFGEVAPLRLLLGLPVVTLSAAAPITISGIGLRELLAMHLFGQSGYPPDAAAAAAAASFVGAHLLPGLWAVPFEFLHRRRAGAAPA